MDNDELYTQHVVIQANKIEQKGRGTLILNDDVQIHFYGTITEITEIQRTTIGMKLPFTPDLEL